MENYEIAIIGGGPAGLAAAVAARDAGAEKVLILERDRMLGGILNQCIHNGFGLHTFQEELTGPEYADRFIRMAAERKIEYKINTMVIDMTSDRVITAVNREDGLFRVRAGAVILAMGCRERPRGALNIPGYRPAGIYTAGTAQRLVNMEGYLPGRRAVILGSGDIGLIMARRMTLEGAKVLTVAEIMPYSGGLKRNIVQCLDDFHIPLRLSTTVVDIEGKERVEGVTLARVDEKRRPVPGTEEHYDCDTLLLSVGLIPENDLSRKMGVKLSPVTGGPLVNESLETNLDGVFACGNVLHVHDLVDYVSEEAGAAGRSAVRFIRRKKQEGGESALRDIPSGMDEAGKSAISGRTDGKKKTAPACIPIVAGDGVRYTVPSCLRPSFMDDQLTVRFRVSEVFRDCRICVYVGREKKIDRKCRIAAPGEMQQIVLKKEDAAAACPDDTVQVCIRKKQDEGDAR